MSTSKKKLLRISCGTVVIVGVFLCVLYVLGVTSEPYKLARHFICSNAVVTSNLGKNIDAGLAFWGYSITSAGAHGTADFEIGVKGSKGSGKAYVSMEKELGEWKVMQARLRLSDGKFIPIPVTPPSGE